MVYRKAGCWWLLSKWDSGERKLKNYEFQKDKTQVVPPSLKRYSVDDIHDSFITWPETSIGKCRNWLSMEQVICNKHLEVPLHFRNLLSMQQVICKKHLEVPLHFRNWLSMQQVICNKHLEVPLHFRNSTNAKGNQFWDFLLNSFVHWQTQFR